MRIRAHVHYTSSTHIGGKGIAGASSLHNLRGFLHGIGWIMFHGHLDYFQRPPLGGRPNTKWGDQNTMNAHNRWIFLFLSWMEVRLNSIWSRARSHMTSHYTQGPWPHYMISEVSWDGLWTLSFGLSQIHGHGSWLVCEVPLVGNIFGSNMYLFYDFTQT